MNKHLKGPAHLVSIVVISYEAETHMPGGFLTLLSIVTKWTLEVIIELEIWKGNVCVLVCLYTFKSSVERERR